MNEAWESLGRAADMQRRLDTIGRRMVPGSLAGSTETASLPSPLPNVVNAGQAPDKERAVFHFRGPLAVGNSPGSWPIPTDRTLIHVSITLGDAPTTAAEAILLVGATTIFTQTLSVGDDLFDAAPNVTIAGGSKMRAGITDAGVGATELVIVATLR